MNIKLTLIEMKRPARIVAVGLLFWSSTVNVGLQAQEKKIFSHTADLRSGKEYWAIPNAGRRTVWEAAKAKREGLRAGVLDLTILWQGGVAFIEFKSGRGDCTETQKDMLDDLHRRGHHCGVFRNSATALAWLKEIGAPVIIL